MPTSNPFIEESANRLAHLRTLPLTEPRKREILSLERILARTTGRVAEKQRPRRVAKTHADKDDDAEEDVAAPQRKKVERAGGHKKVILRVSRPETSEIDDKNEERDRKERLNNTLVVLGLKNRGMS